MDVVVALIEIEANINSKKSGGQAPLHIVVGNSNLEIESIA